MPKVSEEYFENKKKEIIDAAYQVCLEKPITSIVLQDITDKAGFAHGTIYKYYKNVDEILYELFACINTEVDIEERWNEIIDSSTDWKDVIHKSCNLIRETFTSTEIGKFKIAVYADAMRVSDPERAINIALKMQNYGRSPLLVLEEHLREYLMKVVQEESLHPSDSVDSILQFMFIFVRGFQTQYTISESFHAEIKSDEMFSCLADSLISMLGGN